MDVFLVAVKCVCSSVNSNADDDDLTAFTTLGGQVGIFLLCVRCKKTLSALHQAFSALNETICGAEMCVRHSNAIWHNASPEDRD